MAPYAFHVVKSMLWRGQAEEFENTYHYDLSPNPSESLFQEVLNALVTEEKHIHTGVVTYLRARVHGPTNGTQAEDQMRLAVDLAGTGEGPQGVPIPREMAVVASWYLGRSAKGYKRFLRKYYHVGFMNAPGSDAALGNANMSASERDFWRARINDVKVLTVNAAAVTLCAPNGDMVPIGTPTEVLPALHVRQFRG
jgi:hypothetical protein